MTDLVSTILRLDRAGFGHADIARLAKCSLAKVKKHVAVQIEDPRFRDMPTAAMRRQAEKIADIRGRRAAGRRMTFDELLDEDVRFLRLCSTLGLTTEVIARFLCQCGTTVSRGVVQNACNRLSIRTPGPGARPRVRAMAEA